MAPLRVATRGSALARCQAERVVERLGGDAELVIVSTRGDERADVPIHAIGRHRRVREGGAGARSSTGAPTSPCTRPRTCPPGRPPASCSPPSPSAATPVTRSSAARSSTCRPAPASAPARCAGGRSSPALRPDLGFGELRGNIPTRLEKAAQFDAVVVAAAALDRLGARRPDRRAARPVGRCCRRWAQGALAVECRADDAETRARLAAIDDPAAAPGGRRRAGVPRRASAAGATCRAARSRRPRSERRHDRARGAAGVARRAHRAAGAGRRATTRRPSGVEVARRPARRARRPRRCSTSSGDRREAPAVTVYLVGAGPGDPGTADRARRRAARAGRRRRLRPARRPGRSSSSRRPAAERIYVGKAPGRVELDQDEINALLVEHGRGGGDRRAAEGWRPVRVRPGRRGGRGAGRRRRPVRGRARHHQRDRRRRPTPGSR